METQTCNTCEENLTINNFSIRNARKKTYHKRCKKCTNIYAKQYRNENPELLKQKNKEWYNNKGKLWKQEYDKENKHLQRNYEKNRYKTDKNYRLKKILRTRLNKTCKGVRKSTTMLSYLGIEYKLFLIWIEFQFDNTMNWKNYGSYWDIDHVWPCNKFDLTNEKEIFLCFNWRNLQPLKKSINNIKRDKILSDMCLNQIKKCLKFETLYTSTSSLEEINDILGKNQEGYNLANNIYGQMLS